jgi:N-acetylglucosamine malate deacetylase 1
MGNLKMLVIAPHPDDSILGAGGTMVRFIKNGGDVTVLTIAAHKPPLFSEELFHKTIEEAQKALSLIGVKESIFKNIPALFVNKLETHELNELILEVIQRISPDILLIPYLDRNIDHSVIFKSAMVSSRPSSTQKEISIIAAYEILSSTHFNAPYIEPNFMPNWVIDISDYIENKIDALRCCESQFGNMPHPRSYEASKALALFRGSQAGMAYGEGFYIIRMTILPENFN